VSAHIASRTSNARTRHARRSSVNGWPNAPAASHRASNSARTRIAPTVPSAPRKSASRSARTTATRRS